MVAIRMWLQKDLIVTSRRRRVLSVSDVRDALVAGAADKGRELARKLEQFADHPLVGDVRSFGLAGALDFLRRDADDVLPGPAAPR